jgi:hypothetical protein
MFKAWGESAGERKEMIDLDEGNLLRNTNS